MSSDGFCPKANKEFSDEIIFLAPCPEEEETFASVNADGAENRKQLKAEEKIGDVIEDVIEDEIGAIDVVFPAVAAKEEKQRIGDVGALKPYGLKADLLPPGEDNLGDNGVISEGVRGLEKHEEK